MECIDRRNYRNIELISLSNYLSIKSSPFDTEIVQEVITGFKHLKGCLDRKTTQHVAHIINTLFVVNILFRTLII